MIALTFLTHNDNYLLLYNLRRFIDNTDLTNYKPIFYILLQDCSKSFVNSIENIFNSYYINDYNIIIENNIGLSKSNNLLTKLTKDFKYVLHIEDDWVLYDTNKEWLNNCINFLETNQNISTIALRKYSSEKEKHMYGWTRTIPYMCHKYKDNFNYQNKLSNKIDNFTEIINYLFTFNPVIRRNKDYYKCNVYPLPEFNDIDTKEDLFVKGSHSGEYWGFCEALTMEKIRDLKTYMYKEGCFIHFDDSLEILKENKLTIYTNNFEKLLKKNYHIPVLLIHSDDKTTRIVNLKHNFIFPLNFYLNEKYENSEIFGSIKDVLKNYSPKIIITIGKKILDLENIPIEYKNKIYNYENIKNINVKEIEKFIKF